ncbi:A disintegrin and metalloproteinase with thrombospondin motifs 14 isoform X5 [Rhinolophus ferrumequinum]|uniref:A disintegrin and metalloproteinase with thrombospondin motifs 14 isoform X5 n=1 Tax=Rhinolophus ferrumequinum TaxID=59479 RepID=UPI00140F6AC3|nr:A disintegrin and metalloproteinase with thrombospondin motifs 14 isoform X5 [Rhinolophus ferrumequinum]
MARRLLHSPAAGSLRCLEPAVQAEAPRGGPGTGGREEAAAADWPALGQPRARPSLSRSPELGARAPARLASPPGHMAPLRALLSCLLPLHCALCAAAGSPRTPAELHLSRKLGDYGVTVPCSTDFRGRFLSHVVSGPAAASEGNAAVARPPAPPSHPGHLRVARSPLRPEGATRPPGQAGRYSLYFNITVFGEELHLRLQPNRRLVVPGASAEWQEDFEEVFRQPLQRECVYTGGVTGMPGAAVAISNCDGLAGLIRTESTDYFIEPLERGQQEKEASGRTHVVYRREVIQQKWTEPDGDLYNEAFGLGDLPNLLGLVGDQLGEAERKRRHAKPGSYSIEVLLVVDDSVVRFHGKEHVQNYVLTLMNIVDEIYHDESLGTHINIALVRLIMVGYRQSLSLIERGNPSRSLEQVCRWAHSQQRQDPSHAEHHDHVVFLTRQDFGPSGMQGYAPVTGMCHPLRSCALNHEDGFSSAFVVAHETGHVPAYGGRLCSGPMFQYQVCNSEECPGPYEDFRAQQCAKRNSYYIHQNTKHSWMPYEPDDDAQKCELICQSEDTGDVVFMNQVVHDGTRCSYRDPYSVCARGECVPVGCDKEVGSMKADDKCGVCGGDNSHCRTVKGTLGKASKQAGALKLVQIPAGARHIQIEEMEKASHHIAVKNQVTDSFILNPKGKEATSRTFTAMGLEWEYAVQDAKESLKTSGPLPEAIAVLMLPSAEGGPRGSLAYKYVIHEDLLPLIGSNNVLLEETDTYEWALKSWAPCTKACGGGIQFTKYGCRRRRDHHMVQRHLCDHKKRPKPIRRRCNQHQCPQPEWVLEEWGTCSRSCGKLGVQTRGVQCLLPLSNGTHKTMPAKACPGDRPEARRPCLRVPCPAQWRTGAWSQCSATCGEGIQQRQVVCRTNANSLRQCEGDKPDTIQVCSLPACGGTLQNSTVRADVRELVTPEGQWMPQSGPLHPINKISTEPCVGDRSIFCQMEVLDRYCSIPGYHRLCCESCTKKSSGPDASPDPRLASPSPFSTPGSPLPGSKTPKGAVEPTVGPMGSTNHPHGPPIQLPGPLGSRPPVTQRRFAPQKLSPGAVQSTSAGTTQWLPWGWTTGAPMPASENKGQLREDLQHSGTSLPATSPVT